MNKIQYGRFIWPIYLLLFIPIGIIIGMISLSFFIEDDSEFDKWSVIVFNAIPTIFCLLVIVFSSIKIMRIYGKDITFFIKRKRKEEFIPKSYIQMTLLGSIIFSLFVLFATFSKIINVLDVLSIHS